MTSRYARAPRFAFAVLAAAFLAAVPARAQITNGSLTGPIKNNGLPPGWTVKNGSPDTMNETNNAGALLTFAAPPSASPNGGTWVGLGRSTSLLERMLQPMSGLGVGQLYTVSWYAANFGAVEFGYIQPNQIEMLINGISVGMGATLAVGPNWFAQSLNFIAASATDTLAFQLGNDNTSYLGIDGIAVTRAGPLAVVPEPATMMLMAIGLLAVGGLARCRRPA